jgi:hypothetical protein
VKYLFIGNRLVDRPDTWMEITHTGPRPPETMTIVVELYAEAANPRQRGQIGRASQVRHRYYRHTLGRWLRGEESKEKFVYLHESIGGAADRSIPLSNEMAESLWDEIEKREAADRG